MPALPDDTLPDTVIFAHARDGHAARLATALEVRGTLPAVVSLADCHIDTRAPAGIAIPGFTGLGCAEALPRLAIVRGVPAGSFEQVTTRLALLHGLARAGCRVVNSAAAIEACIDKSATTQRLVAAGLPTPETVVCETRSAAAAVLASGGDWVLKPLFGAQGVGLSRVRTAADLPAEADLGGLYYLQRYAGTASAPYRDFRVFTLGGRAIAGMVRTADAWITNVAQGGAPRPLALTGRFAELAVAAAAACGADYAGVDLIAGEDGALAVLEVNSMPAWSGLETANPGLDVAALIVAELLAGPGAARAFG